MYACVTVFMQILELMASTIAQDFRHIGLLEEVANLFNNVSTRCSMGTVKRWMTTRYGGWVRHGLFAQVFDVFYATEMHFKQPIT